MEKNTKETSLDILHNQKWGVPKRSQTDWQVAFDSHDGYSPFWLHNVWMKYTHPLMMMMMMVSAYFYASLEVSFDA